MSKVPKNKILHVMSTTKHPDGTIVPPVQSGSLEQQVSGQQKENITTFTTDTDTPVAEVPQRHDPLKQAIAKYKQIGSQDIIDFMEKPQRILSGVMAVTDSSIMWTRPMPHTLLASAQLSPKITGVFMIRADLVFTINLNATRFQQGRYILAFYPTGGASAGTTRSQQLYRQHAASLMTITQLPHIEIDLSQQTTAQLIIPYQSVQPYFNKSQSGQSTWPGDLGLLFLVPYSPLQIGSSGSVTCDYAVWGNFANITLSGASLQSKTITRKEQDDMNIAPVSGALSRVATATSILGEIPLLTSIAQPASWVLEVLSRSAKSLGFSKPIVLDAPHRMSIIRNVYMNNVDGAWPAAPMGGMSNNEVVLSSGVSATQVDEMSFAFIKKQYAFYRSVDWSTSTAVGFDLHILDHNPTIYTASLGPAFTEVPVSMLSRFFKYWRGGMRFKFKIVKTEFHSGRLILAYTPFDGRYAAPPYNIDSGYFLAREIIDIRQTSEFEVCVPYVCTDPYRVTDSANTVGRLYLSVLDRLVAPDTVPPTVRIIVEVSGADDLEYAVPVWNNTSMWVYSPPTAHSGYKSIGCVEFGPTIFGSEMAEICIGEQFHSIKQLLSRMDRGVAALTVTPTTCAVITPHYATYYDNVTLPFQPGRPFDQLHACYVFASGGVNVQFVQSTTNGIDVAVSHRPTQGAFNNVGTTFPGDAGTFRTPPGVESSVINVSLPSYSRFLCRNASQFMTNGVTPISNQEGFNVTSLQFSTTLTAPADWTFKSSRSVMDDYVLSYWLGTVPLYLVP